MFSLIRWTLGGEDDMKLEGELLGKERNRDGEEEQEDDREGEHTQSMLFVYRKLSQWNPLFFTINICY